jgi:hypothetical protein
MSDFFKSEMVRGDLQEITDLQMYCVRASSMLPALSPTKLIEYFDVLMTLIEKQKIFFARLSLSEDKEAKEMSEMMREMTIMLGADPNESMYAMFDQLIDRIQQMRKVAEQKLAQDP